MHNNLNLLINIVLLVGVVAAISSIMKSRRQKILSGSDRFEVEEQDFSGGDDIISVRKLNTEIALEEVEDVSLQQETQQERATQTDESQPVIKDSLSGSDSESRVIMLFLLAKEGAIFAGYDLLQSLLSEGLCYGEGQLFHRHQFAGRKGPIICSLAAATSDGQFDLENMGAFSARGLCLFMHTSGNSSIDEERFGIMLETARALEESLDCHLLDAERQPLTEEGIRQLQEQF